MTAEPVASALLSQRVRAFMAQVPAAVAVVTTRSGGDPHGTTVSAFTLLSMDPPMFGICLDNDSALLSKLRLGAVVGVNVLTVDQAEVAARYARKATGILDGDDRQTDSQPPRLPEAHAVLVFTVTQFLAVGDHTLVVGDVDTADCSPQAPLVYWQRTYGTHSSVGERPGSP